MLHKKQQPLCNIVSSSKGRRKGEINKNKKVTRCDKKCYKTSADKEATEAKKQQVSVSKRATKWPALVAQSDKVSRLSTKHKVKK